MEFTVVEIGEYMLIQFFLAQAVHSKEQRELFCIFKVLENVSGLRGAGICWMSFMKSGEVICHRESTVRT